MNPPSPAAPPPAYAEARSSLARVLDTLLDRGVVLRADLTLTLGDVPLAALQLHALLGGAQTFLEHGLPLLDAPARASASTPNVPAP